MGEAKEPPKDIFDDRESLLKIWENEREYRTKFYSYDGEYKTFHYSYWKFNSRSWSIARTFIFESRR